jgi:hypothetical protein
MSFLVLCSATSWYVYSADILISVTLRSYVADVFWYEVDGVSGPGVKDSRQLGSKQSGADLEVCRSKKECRLSKIAFVELVRDNLEIGRFPFGSFQVPKVYLPSAFPLPGPNFQWH